MTMIESAVGWFRTHVLGQPRWTGVSPFAEGLGPARVLVLRHAEKTGDTKDPHLSEEGWQHARRLAETIPARYGRPDFLFAARTSKRSSRPTETLQPLADVLAIKVDGRFDDDEFEDLVEELAKQKYAGKLAVISWRHSEMPQLAAALGAHEDAVPSPWPSDLYDLIIDIEYPKSVPPRATRRKRG